MLPGFSFARKFQEDRLYLFFHSATRQVKQNLTMSVGFEILDVLAGKEPATK